MGLFNRFKRSADGGSNTAAGSSIQGPPTAEDQEAEKKNKVKSRRKSFFQFISPSDVTTESLQVWAGLPQKIRLDPSMASFQLECDRLHGKRLCDDGGIARLINSISDEGLDIEVNNEETVLDSTLDTSNAEQLENNGAEDHDNEEEEADRSEFITIKMTSPSSSPETSEENENEIT